MSAITATAPFDRLTAALEQRARILGDAAAQAARLQRSAPDRVWRNASLLWPLFTKG
jgi:hypothetical protein